MDQRLRRCWSHLSTVQKERELVVLSWYTLLPVGLLYLVANVFLVIMPFILPGGVEDLDGYTRIWPKIQDFSGAVR